MRHGYGARLGGALILTLALTFVLGAAAQVASAAAGRGIIDNRLELGGIDTQEVPALVTELGPARLHARWTRLLVHWTRLQPVAPGVSFAGDADGDGYDDAYVAELDRIVDGLAKQGVNVIVSPTEVPAWASNQQLWKTTTYGGYSPNLAMDVSNPDVLAAFGKLGAFLASGLSQPIHYLECWNEPNTAGTFYPQRTTGNRHFGLQVYVKMLRAFHAAVKAVQPDAVVIAGATAPRGADDESSTAPRTFATYLRDAHAGKYFEAYSHHPYCWGPPKAKPNDRRAIWLSNLGQLLSLFPKKPFYLTEFGYGTADPTLIGLRVTPATQAKYLREGYAYVARYPQVKALLWFMVQDLPPASDRLGAYMGLRYIDGARKLAWYAFARDASVTLSLAGSATSKTRALTGVLTSRAFGPLTGKAVSLEQRAPGGRWHRVRNARTGSDGQFRFVCRATRARLLYRAAWSEVCDSRSVAIQAAR
jgi:hypothetical protein